jgi:hypothetical protein
MNELRAYASQVVEKAGKVFSSGELFAKVLSSNDDSGKHGVLIPTDAYSYFSRLTDSGSYAKRHCALFGD